MHRNSQPVFAVSLGDPNGIGPEIIIKTLIRRDIQQLGTFIVFVPGALWNQYRKLFGETLSYVQIEKIQDIRYGKINILNIQTPDFKLEFGAAVPAAGKLAFDSLNEAAEAVKTGKCDILITAPINKATIQSERFRFPGHTEFLEDKWGGNNLMFMVHDDIKVGLVTQHIPLNEVARTLSAETITTKLNLMHQSLVEDFGIRMPKIAVTGLNPHAGDSGLLGKEENELIIPALSKIVETGKKVFGPFPSDSFFTPHTLDQFDGVLAMYHDQGLTPFKTIAGIEGVNFTAGLPFVRTSPDHGVGYDIAGQNTAGETSMVEAVYTAIEIFQNRKMYRELTQNALPVETENKRSRRSARYE